MTIDHTHAPDATSWVPGADEHPDFPVQNLPLGIFSNDGARRAGCAIGGWILDLSAMAEAGLIPAEGIPTEGLGEPTLNSLFAAGRPALRALRHALFALLTDENKADAVSPHLHDAADCTMHMPFRVGDYTDFYVGINHAMNIGKQFRPDNPLLPNYKHVPIGYHGRASSIRASGAPVIRPHGQVKPPEADGPTLSPTGRLDFELELGLWVMDENELGQPVPIADAWDRIGGLCLLNDWSARDIQGWEYQPLGPFLAKNFLSTVSPWVVTADALAPFRTAQQPRPEGDPQPLPYLSDADDQAGGALSLDLAATITSAKMRKGGMEPHVLSRSAARSMYWTPAQMVAHHTVNGCNLQPGDLLGTGTISGPDDSSCGSMTEITLGGKQPITLPTGEVRRFLEDGDELVLSAKAVRDGYRSIGLGPCAGRVAVS